MNEWLFSVLLALAPPDRYAAAQQFPGWSETPAQRTDRYRAIAADLAAVLAEGGRLFTGPAAERQTAALILAVAHHESGFAPDVDIGPCYRGRDGRSLRCDAGRAACILQVRAANDDEKRALFADRRRCFREGLRILRRSLGACSTLEPAYRLAAYASGSCRGGRKESKEITALAQRIESMKPPPKPQ